MRTRKVSIKSKKSIRKLAGLPLTRRAAHITRSVRGLKDRLDILVDYIYRLETECRAETARANLNWEVSQGLMQELQQKEKAMDELMQLVPDWSLSVAKGAVADATYGPDAALNLPSLDGADRLKGELVAMHAGAHGCVAASSCRFEPGGAECNDCPNWQLDDALLDAHDGATQLHELGAEYHRESGPK